MFVGSTVVFDVGADVEPYTGSVVATSVGSCVGSVVGLIVGSIVGYTVGVGVNGVGADVCLILCVISQIGNV